MRPHIVLFNEELMPIPFNKCLDFISERAGIAIIVGLSARQGYMLKCFEALKKNRWDCFEVNPIPTPISPSCYPIRHHASRVLTLLVAELKSSGLTT